MLDVFAALVVVATVYFIVRGTEVRLALLAGGAVLAIASLKPEAWFLNLFGRYQEMDGNNDVSLLPGFSSTIYTSPLLRACTTTGTTPCSIAAFDDTTFTSVWGMLKYQIAKQWTAGVGLGYEDYSIDDAQTGSGVNYLPASFFLQADNRDYEAWVGYLQLKYTWQ